MLKILLSIILILLIGCSERSKINSPLSVVIKLQSAETLADFEEAKKYIDVEKVYHAHSDSINADKAWRSKVLFFYNLGKDKKFTNAFKYYEYNIIENEKGNHASVIFKSIDSKTKIKEVIYRLIDKGDGWLVVGIEYIK